MPLYLGFNIEDLLEKEKFVMKLPLKKRRFVDAFITTLSVEKASQIVGISLTRGYNLLKKPEVQTAISYLQDIISFRNTITQDYFVNKLKDIIEDNQTKAPDRISALNLLARITGHIKEKPENTTQVVVLKQQGLMINGDDE